ncbi:hypothetical protein D3C87_1995060 [compost metagenome]
MIGSGLVMTIENGAVQLSRLSPGFAPADVAFRTMLSTRVPTADFVKPTIMPVALSTLSFSPGSSSG